MISMAQKSHPGLDAPATLPPAITAKLLADVDLIAKRMTRRLADEIPLGSDFRSIGYLRMVMAACRDALRILLRLLHDGRGPRASELNRLGDAGSRQAELGVPLEVLLSAYRLAAKVVWREVIAETMGIAELPPATLIGVTEQILEYLDRISGAVGQSYLETRERLMRQRDRERDRTLQRLLAGDDSPELRRLAASLDIDLHPPYRVVACVMLDDADADRVLAPITRSPHDGLVIPDEPGIWIGLIGPDVDPLVLWPGLARDGPRGTLRIGVGPVAETLADVAPAARRARQALSIGERLAPGQAVHYHTEVAIFGALTADRGELAAYVEQVLGPVLDGQGGRTDLLATLDALVTSRSLTEAARRLGLHRHTLVYRIQRLRDVLGGDVDDPSERHRLWLALQALRLLGTEPA
jgi:hypothetical protein